MRKAVELTPWLVSEVGGGTRGGRRTYARSMALASMLGYVVGLGDRHLSNILLDTVTAEIVHIDLGTCVRVSARGGAHLG